MWKTSKSPKGDPSFKILSMGLEDLGCNKRNVENPELIITRFGIQRQGETLQHDRVSNVISVGTSNVAARSMTRPSLEFNLRNEEPPWV
ncbi:hypothetical protein HZH66_012799 [Vespula vulgaris]|uniref:Uncharacterized protein n=1 Tax=Vespula vulgaris TaxID=7454 RepID=A0A834MTU1_VESVU|nr:hypothetical protein HZH66_012799 [Vespula vulgaris]